MPNTTPSSTWLMRVAIAAALGLTCTLIASCAQTAAPTGKIDRKKLDKYYADAATPNIAGVWHSVSDGYRAPMVSDTQKKTGMQSAGNPNDTGLPPGVLPRDFWIVDGKPLPGHSAGGPWVGIPYTPKWQAAYDQRVADNAAGKIHGSPHSDCLPRGAMGSYNTAPNAFTITQTPGRVQQIFYQEQVGLHNIYTDGRGHPTWSDVNSDDYEPTPYGHSIGHWEGNTLVVDTVGVDRAYTLGYLAMHSDVFHMVERITPIDDTHIDIDIVIDDKKALLKPMSMKIRFELLASQDYKEETCSNNRNVTDENGFVQTLLRPKKAADWDLPND